MTTTTPVDPRSWFRWKPSEESPSVTFSREIMAAIRSHVLDSRGAAGGRGSETGGLLLGRHEASTGEFTIEGFEPIPLAAQSGFYSTTQSDLPFWRSRVQARRQTEQRFIGIYRSHTRPGLNVTSDDCSLVETVLPREEGIFLLVKPLSEKECVGALFHCDGGAVIDEASEGREFPLTGIAPVPRTRSRWWKAVIPLTAVLAGIAVALTVRAYRQPQGGENPVAAVQPEPVLASDSPFALHAERSGDMIHVSWNSSAPALRKAGGAVLTGTDGTSTTALHLSPRDIAAGFVNWKAMGTIVSFQMRIDPSGPSSPGDSAQTEDSAAAIKSSSASDEPKPISPRAASAPSGELKQPRRATAQFRPRSERVEPPALKPREQGRVKRAFDGFTSKASHLWPFHSASSEQRKR